MRLRRMSGWMWARATCGRALLAMQRQPATRTATLTNLTGDLGGGPWLGNTQAGGGKVLLGDGSGRHSELECRVGL